MLQAIEKIQACTNDMSYDEFADDWMVVDIVQMNLLVFGEAARHIPDSILWAYPDIPWMEIRGLRNVIAHEYDRVDFEIVWTVVQEELPPLVPLL
jgi:uncharacterized protein with HEPN domain